MSLQELFNQYEASHQHPMNKLFHALGIPSIVAAIVWLAADWNTQGIFPSTAWYLFMVGWIFQFIGHAFERTWPEFMRNPVFLIVGPLYFLNKVLGKNKKTTD